MIEEQERMGWQLIAKPIIGKMRIVEEQELPGSRFTPRGGIWHPFQLFRQHVIPSAHPLVRPESDIYVIWLPMAKKHEVVRLEISDDLLRRRIAEGNPIMDKVEIT